MVAYGFKAMFEEDIVMLRKRQTVRGNRKRHARPGEPMQLYTAMRTKYCRKLLKPDPVCIDVRPIRIDLVANPECPIKSIEIEGIALDDNEIEEFAIADGFGASLFDGWARRRMGAFWLKNHPWNLFMGVVLRWEPGAE